MLLSINPATGALRNRFPEHTQEDVDAALDAARNAQLAWRETALADRSALLRAIAAALRSRADVLARVVTEEMGKPYAEALAEVEKCAWCCTFYAEKGPDFLAPEPIATEAAYSAATFDPLGVVFAIMPWNYPLWQFFRFFAPALMAGNGVVLKHASNVPECALLIADVLREAQVPEGLAGVLMIGPDPVGAIIADDRIAAITLTGSTAVGAVVAAQAGAALKKQVLELGGSDPFIVLADADIAKAAAAGVRSRFINNGQSCVNAKRFIVEASVADAFADAFCAEVERLKVGDPMDDGVSIGPMARDNLRAELHAQVQKSVERGAVARLGGRPIDGAGSFYAPTVLDQVAPGMPAFDEELFGPVAAIIRADDREHAIALANRSEYGLGAAIWTADTERARAVVPRIEAGAVFINAIVASHPHLPFGGIKKSGYGRELGSYGLREFVNVKTVWVGGE
ncbi:NAD-dependent succinate-semialdehyde dehydrogenase [Devosia sp. YIM 151766]|uniref:NAD-dependent succinate-semialdehyde dehydrogenase n=1 Tax=Devosia sp. YIM 151766 TaxID=3017325 RepID=UPI00255CAA05|nr:NAD-dependent succinate-semialdehyde dehydrogenase [Devosia sp. YIM 151766]WIY52746.1 NAD-dependent succinate-semialdehyde dehydrogenase [Devosia sp. YIM 151766]